MKNYTRIVQTRVITEMTKLLDRTNFIADLYSVRSAAPKVSGENDSAAVGSRRSITCLVRVCSRAVERWWAHWLNFKMLPLDTKRRWKIQKATKWTEASTVELKKIVDECPVLFLDEIGEKLKLKFKRDFGGPSISKRLRQHLNYSRKVVCEKATQQRLNEKLEFIVASKHYIQKADMVIYIDESNKDRKAARRKYGWSAKGTPANYRSLFNMDTRYTFIGAANYLGYVIPACDIVLHRYREKDEEKPVDAEGFVEYVERKLVPVLGNFSRQESNFVVVMDN